MSKKQIANIKQLHQKKFRELSGLFIVEGEKSVSEVMKSNWEIASLYAVPEWVERHSMLLANFVHYTVSQEELERISCLRTPQEVIAVVRKIEAGSSDIDTTSPLLILDGIRDPGNMGTIIRTADWFGIAQILCSEDSVELTNPKVIQATMGSFLRVKVVHGNIVDFLNNLSPKQNVYGTFMEGKPIQEVVFNPTDIVIIGNEGKGISENVTPLISERITIPHPANRETESLNASIAAGIVLYELGK
ncbi:RNA methyltransferase [Bacteroidales bacterium OttesenSCG-928-E04]|nr:RNA methyltransferase [Bacteroidales bacterium OttesenSCG-928-E04]